MFVDDIEALYNDLNKDIDDIKKLCKENPSKIKIEKSNNLIEVANENEEENTLCHTIEVTTEWISWSIKLSDRIIAIPSKLAELLSIVLDIDVSEILQMGIEKIIKLLNDEFEKALKNNKTIQKIKKLIKKIIKQIKIITLQAKQILLQGQLFVYKNLKKALENLANGKVCGAISNICAGALAVLQQCSLFIATVLEVINQIISMLGLTFMSIEGGTMSFFATPKTIMSGLTQKKIKPKEQNNDLGGSSCVSMVDEFLDKIVNQIKDQNNAIKLAYISSQVNSYNNSGQLPSFSGPNLIKLDINDLREKAMTFLSSLMVSEPMPKYENLKLTNIRYVYWLTTVFCPAMQASFGLPM